MRPLDRYMKELRTHLPGEQADDIANELEANLREQLEDRETEVGRSLTDAEQEAILREHGNPILFAARYRPEQGTLAFGRQLIGPALFPAYARVLSINLTVTAFVLAMITVILTASGEPFGSTLSGVPLAILIQFGIVTAIFAVADRALTSETDPRTAAEAAEVARTRRSRSPLDRVAEQFIGADHPLVVPRRTSVSDLAINVIGAGWLIFVRPPFIIGPMQSGPGWEPFQYAAIVVLGLAAVPPLITLIRPGLARLRTVGRFVADLAFVAILAGSSITGRWLVLTDEAGATEQLRRSVGEINRWIGVSLAVALGITILMTLLELRRLVVHRHGEVESRSRQAV
jgi:hypothetical protein